MRSKNSTFSAKTALFKALFVQKSANFQTRNLQFASLPAFLGFNSWFSTTADPEFEEWDLLPNHENRKKRILPKI